MRDLRLTHPSLDFWIDVRLRQFDGRWLAVADLAGEPEIGAGETSRAALARALRPFSSQLVAEVVEEGRTEAGRMRSTRCFAKEEHEEE